jgi:hypothetical protein
MAILQDIQIAALLADPKPILRGDIAKLKNGKPNRRGEIEAKLPVTSKARKRFTVTSALRSDPLKFSIILSYSYYGRHINLIRCNGHHREHTNVLEKASGEGIVHIPANTFHIHRATYRYQVADMDAEWYAEPTNGYFSFKGAVEFMCSNFGFYLKDDDYGCLYPLLKSES